MIRTPHISLDLQTHFSPTIDISGGFVASEIHAMNNGRFKPVLDTILPRKDIFLPTNTRLEVDEFLTFPMLDIVLPELIASDFWQGHFPELRSRKQTINLVSPLRVPHNSLDIRREKTIISEQKYSDLFVRKLPVSARVKRFSRHSRVWWRRWKIQVLWSLATVFLVIFPTIFYIKFLVEDAYNTLLSLPKSENISEVRVKIASAKGNFERASFLFTPFSWIPAPLVDTAHRATDAGREVARGLDLLVNIIPENADNFSPKIVENSDKSLYRASSKDIFLLENLWIPLPTNTLKENNDKIFSAFSSFIRAGEIYKNAKGDTKYDTIMREVGMAIENFAPILEGYEKNNENILAMLGHKDPERYIIFNQNRDEIRTNGGFPGSIISFTLYKGNILDYRTDDVYYYDWNLYPHQETPPPGIALLTNNYGLRDVNYYPDFQKTLEKANDFVERSGESTLTTAVAIHQGIIEEILQVIGEVSVDGVSEKFSSDNFSLLMSILVENKFAKDKTPKDILFKFISAFGKQALESKKIAKISEIILESWNRGEILMASRNEKHQKFLASLQKPLPWNTDHKNWIYPIFTSVSGNKSDRYISRSVEAKTKYLQSCEYETTVNVYFSHDFSVDDEKKINNIMNNFGLNNQAEREKMQFIQWNGKNKSFVRLFVPKWAELVGSGAEVSFDENATIFSFLLETPVGGNASKTLSYKQNIENCAEYNDEIFIDRQPWLREFVTP